MNSGRVLVALEEQEKWRDRRTRLQARLRSVQSRRRFLLRELDAVRRRVERLEEIVFGAVEERGPWERAYMRLDR